MAIPPKDSDQATLSLFANLDVALVSLLTSKHPECEKLRSHASGLLAKVSARTRVLQRAVKAAAPEKK